MEARSTGSVGLAMRLSHTYLERTSVLMQKWRWPAGNPTSRQVISVSQLKACTFTMIGSNDLYPDRQTISVETSRNSHCRTTCHRDREHDFHPLIIGFHSPASDLLWPIKSGIEREQLRRGGEEIVKLFEKSPD